MAKSFLCAKAAVLRVSILGFLLLVAVAPLISLGRQQQAARVRPRIGLALNGEGAIGFTQIGVLEWLTEHHIPVDYIAGTSVGGLVGGAYATAMSPLEIRHFLEEIDFSATLFLGEAPYQEKGKWVKSETIKLPGLPDLQLEAYMSTKSPDLIVPLLPGIVNSYRDLRSFDDLPIPFRCLATDLHSGKLVVLDRGSLPEALRATITLIGVSSPVRVGDGILVSGAIVDSIPTDVVRRMGADIVIASFTSATTAFASKEGENEFSLPLSQMARTLDIARMTNELRSLQTADVVIHPDVHNFGAGDLNRLLQLVKQGYDAAEAKAAVLESYALSDTDWQEHMENRFARRTH